jgi:hypothetical protein
MSVLIQITRTQVWRQSFVWSWCFHSDKLYRPWFFFITECEFDNKNMEVTPWRHVWGIPTNRSVKWCLNQLSQQFWSCVSRSITGISGNVYSYAILLINWNIKHEKKKQNITHIFNNTQNFRKNLITYSCVQPYFFRILAFLFK